MLSIELIHLPGGTFQMGSEDGADDERPVHSVKLSSYSIARYPVTNEQYSAFLLDSEPRTYAASTIQENFNHPQQPVTSISWYDAVAFCKWLSEITKLPYRLPTEAEWEYAAAAGNTANIYPWGTRSWNEWPELHSLYQNGPSRIAQFEPNLFGLYDFGMNIHEWCSDWYDSGYYAVSIERNPQGPKTGTRRASRGGSWRHQIKITRCAARSSIPPGMRYSDYGFRLSKSD
jgi:formylglycine-generating enzyme required for sulfatase activity